MNDVSDIISKYDSVIEKMISLYRIRAKLYGVDPDDLRQDCRIELWNCLKKKRENDPYFLPYIRVSIRRKIRESLIEKSTNQSRRLFDRNSKKYVFLSDMHEQAMPEDVSHELSFSYIDPTEENLVVSDFIEYCEKKSPSYGDIIKNRINGFTIEETSHRTSINEREVYRKIIDIKDLYRKYFGVEIDEQNDTLASKKSHIG